MPWTTLTLQVTTPLFNGGADPANEAGFRPRDEAGVRVASIRGAMRFWFRALAGAYTGSDIELLAALERRVFGGIARQRDDGEAAVPSPFILRLPNPPRLSGEREPEFLRGRHWRGIAYLLGLGLMEMKGSKPRLVRPFVPPDPGKTFDLKIRFQHDKRATAETRHAIETLAFASLWLASIYGGLGARTRRGFGGVRIVGAEGDMPRPWTPKSIRTPGMTFYENATRVRPPETVIGILEPHLRELISAERKEPVEFDSLSEPPLYPALSTKFSAAALVPREYGSWEETLDRAGRQLRLFRANRPPDAGTRRKAQVKTAEWDEVIHGEVSDFSLGALGLPVGFHDKDKDYSLIVNAVDVSTPEHDQLRRASPLWLRPVGGGESWQLFTYAFQGRFLPDADGVQVRLLPDADARHDGWQEDNLFVDTEHVVRLTDQWISTMRKGGDFVTVIRE
jgi:CRISPR-associated protein Cmr1